MTVRYHIDTIPVWDALQENSECLLCTLRRRTEHLLADRYLGSSVMEPETRIRVNKKGFCSVHHKMLFERQNKLGHALMMLSHLKEIEEKLNAIPTESKNKTTLCFSVKKSITSAKNILSLENLTNGCVLCDQLDDHINHFAYTIIHLWKTNKDFHNAFSVSPGVCLPDAVLLIKLSNQCLAGSDLMSFNETILNQLKESFSRLEEELEWFTKKFDYRNNLMPWGTSIDALERSITKLRSWSVGKDPGKNN